MIFTTDDYRRISEWLNRNSVKDTELNSTSDLNRKDLIPIVQDKENKTISVDDFLSFFETIASNHINVSSIYKKYGITLEEAIALIPNRGRKTGIVVTFFSDEGKWMTYQFNSDSIDNWNDISYWVNTYDNVSKYKGFFNTEEALIELIKHPYSGDYAYVGDSMEDAILYICEKDGEWVNTGSKAFLYANLYEAVNSKDFSELDYKIDEQYCDRAEKDSLGNIIHFTYVTREGLAAFVMEKVLKAVSEIDLPDGCIDLRHLSKSLFDLLTANGDKVNVTNMPDEEDLTTVQINGIDTLRLKDKEYNPVFFSGKGRKYLRKNMVDGVNVLEQHMLDTPDTIYIVQYDYCMNDGEVTVPENSVLQFEGGTINGGKLILSNTHVTGLISREDMGINLTVEGNYIKGQQFFDTTENKPVWWNGEEWITTSTYDFNGMFYDKLNELPYVSDLDEQLNSKADYTDFQSLQDEVNSLKEMLTAYSSKTDTLENTVYNKL